MKGKFPFLLIAFLGILLDLGTKELAFHHTRCEICGNPDQRIEVVHTSWFVLDWHRVENSGGMFGIGQQHGGVLKYFRLVALLLVLYFMIRARPAQKLFLASLALILAGAVGNLYDSFFHGGRVRDFIEVKLLFMPQGVFGRLFDPWPTFNVADSMILIGAILLVIQVFRDPDGKQRSARAGAGDAEKKPA
jgi:lipoprotein signal peptidase